MLGISLVLFARTPSHLVLHHPSTNIFVTLLIKLILGDGTPPRQPPLSILSEPSLREALVSGSQVPPWPSCRPTNTILINPLTRRGTGRVKNVFL